MVPTRTDAVVLSPTASKLAQDMVKQPPGGQATTDHRHAMRWHAIATKIVNCIPETSQPAGWWVNRNEKGNIAQLLRRFTVVHVVRDVE